MDEKRISALSGSDRYSSLSRAIAVARGEFLEARIRDFLPPLPRFTPSSGVSREISRVHGPSSFPVSQCVLRSAAIKISVWLHESLSYSLLFVCLSRWKGPHFTRLVIVHLRNIRSQPVHLCIFFPLTSEWNLRYLDYGDESLLEMRFFFVPFSCWGKKIISCISMERWDKANSRVSYRES